MRTCVFQKGPASKDGCTRHCLCDTVVCASKKLQENEKNNDHLIIMVLLNALFSFSAFLLFYSVRKQNVVYIWFQLKEKMFRGCKNKVKLLQSS